ncbi:hypothetical protein OSTOST_15423, partial [Ostertagia ostertagi]
LGLTDCADSIIGTRSLKGLSGGEKKRVAFAQEILTNPPILLCDEPTSGLDSFLAIQVVNVLKNLAAKKSMTIVFTIHQPSSQVYELFDRVYMMTDGRVAFCGRQDSAMQFWSKLGRPLPRNFNPADHYISSLSVKDPGSSGRRSNKAKVGNYHRHYRMDVRNRMKHEKGSKYRRTRLELSPKHRRTRLELSPEEYKGFRPSQRLCC